MKIAHVTATFPPYRGGTGMVCYNNAVEMAKRGHQVAVFTANHPPGEYDYPAEINVHRLPVTFRIGNAPMLPGLFNLQGFDLIHLHYPFIFGQEMIFFQSLFRHRRYVITYHQDLILVGLLGVGARFHEMLLGKRILTQANRLMFTSLDYGRSSRVASVMKKIPDRIVEMPNGVDTTRFCPELDTHDLRRSYGLTDADRVILFVGGLDTPHYFKGVDVLLRSFNQIDDPTVKLLVVGDGDLRPRYMALAQELGLGERVIFCGGVSDEILPAHYAICDLHVLPSTTMGEAFGIVLLEAMACAKPVIASNLPGVRSVIENGVDGLLVTPGDASDLAEKFRILLDNPERRRDMGARGRARVESTYAWPRVVDRLESVYREVGEDAKSRA
jgi:glycosyltransferase involved in cell wall biosynthesis